MLEDLTRSLTTRIGDLHIKFNAEKITWKELEARATYLENEYLKEVKELIGREAFEKAVNNLAAQQ